MSLVEKYFGKTQWRTKLINLNHFGTTKITDLMDAKTELETFQSLTSDYFRQVFNRSNKRCRNNFLILADVKECSACSIHGQCNWKISKRDQTTSCPGQEECRYHRKLTCYYGHKSLKDCQGRSHESHDLSCPQHEQTIVQIKQAVEQISSPKLLAKLVKEVLCPTYNQLGKLTGMREDEDQEFGHFRWTLHDRIAELIGYQPKLFDIISDLERKAKLIPSNLGLSRPGQVLYRLTKLVGSEHPSVIRFYLKFSYKKPDNLSVNNYCCSFVVPKRLEYSDVATKKYADIFKMDIEFRRDPTISCQREWLKRVQQTRQEIWGDKEESLDIYMILMNVWHGQLTSIFSPIEVKRNWS
jgi:hypothetical protein